MNENDSKQTRIEVDSSNLKAVMHDGEHLTVEFLSGATWRYRDVPAEVVNDLIHAESRGKFFAQQIRGRFQEERVKSDDAEEASE